MRAFVLLLVIAAPLAQAQNSLVEWVQVNGVEPAQPIPPVINGIGPGVLTVYQSRPAFDLDFPLGSQSCEDFEDTGITDALIMGFPAPLDSTTDTALFPAGSIVPGLRLEDDPLNDIGGGSVNGLVAVGVGAVGAASDIVLANTFVDTLNMFFTTAPTGVAMDVFSFTAGGSVVLSYFDATDTLLGSVIVAGSPGVGGFAGVSSPVPIARINLFSQTGAGGDEAEGGDNICFAGGGLPEIPSVPTLNVVGFIGLIMALLAFGAISLRRRTQ